MEGIASSYSDRGDTMSFEMRRCTPFRVAHPSTILVGDYPVMTYLSPTLVCHNPNCQHPIRLPYPLAVSENPPNWPRENWRVIFVCPSCGHGYEYLGLEVRWLPFPTPGPNQPHSSTKCVYCEFECGHENCAIKARHYTIAGDDTQDLDIILSRCLKARCYPLCGAGKYAQDYCAETYLRVRQELQIGPV
jgi:hypothetical protein